MARSEPYPCIASRCPIIENELNGTERPRVHEIIRGVCGFLGFRSAPVLARITGTIRQISRLQDLTVVTIVDGVEVKDHKIPPRDEVLEEIRLGGEVLHGEPLTYGSSRAYCRLQASWAFKVRVDHGSGTLAYERIALLTDVPKSSVFQSEKIAIDHLEKRIGPFMKYMKDYAQAQIDADSI